jgi:hypothetical protein
MKSFLISKFFIQLIIYFPICVLQLHYTEKKSKMPGVSLSTNIPLVLRNTDSHLFCRNFIIKYS